MVRTRLLGPAFGSLLLVASARAAPDSIAGDALREKLGDLELAGNWFYDDLEGGFAEAKKTGKPLLVVFR